MNFLEKSKGGGPLLSNFFVDFFLCVNIRKERGNIRSRKSELTSIYEKFVNNMCKTNLLSSVYTVYISIHLLNIETCVRISNNQPIGNSQPYILYCALKGIQWEGAIYATLKFSQRRPNSGGPGSPVAWIPSKHLYKQPQSGTVSSQCHGKAAGKRSARFIVAKCPFFSQRQIFGQSLCYKSL